MPASNMNNFKQILKKYDNMKNDFKSIESEYENIKSTYMGDLYQMLYSISDFYDKYEEFGIESRCIVSNHIFSDKNNKIKYENIANDVIYKLSKARDMFKEIKSLGELGGGFSDSEIRGINSFKINSLI